MDQTKPPVDIDKILADVDEKMPKEFLGIYKKTVLAGMRIMFGKDSHKMMREQLDKQQPAPRKIAEGVVALFYILYQKSNQTLPPQIVVPVVFALTLKAFEFMQQSGDPDATLDVLGDAVEQSTKYVMQKFGVDPAKVEQIVAQQRGQIEGDGMLPSGGAK